MRGYFVAWFVAAFLLLGDAASAQSWIEYKPDGGRYRVEMPGAPKVATVAIPTGGGSTTPMTEASVTTQARVAYVASYVDYANSVTKGAAPDVILDQVRNGSAAGNTYRDEKKLQLGRSTGREYMVVQANGNVAVTRIYWVRGRLYQLVVEGRSGIEKQPDTRRFLESFDLI